MREWREQARPDQFVEDGVELRWHVRAEPFELDAGEQAAPWLGEHVDRERLRRERELGVAEHVTDWARCEQRERVSERREGRNRAVRVMGGLVVLGLLGLVRLVHLAALLRVTTGLAVPLPFHAGRRVRPRRRRASQRPGRTPPPARRGGRRPAGSGRSPNSRRRPGARPAARRSASCHCARPACRRGRRIASLGLRPRPRHDARVSSRPSATRTCACSAAVRWCSAAW